MMTSINNPGPILVYGSKHCDDVMYLLAEINYLHLLMDNLHCSDHPLKINPI